MRKSVLCFILAFVFSLSGCFSYHYIDAEPASTWVGGDFPMEITIVTGGLAEGTLTAKGKPVEIEIYFGPGSREYVVYEPLSDGDERNVEDFLFDGNYCYNEKNETITFEIIRDQLGLDVSEIILYKTEA